MRGSPLALVALLALAPSAWADPCSGDWEAYYIPDASEPNYAGPGVFVDTGASGHLGTTPAGACQTLVSSILPTVSSCSLVGGNLVQSGDGLVTYQYHPLPVGCTLTGDTSPVSPGAVPMDWSNVSHVVQAGLVASCAFALMLGYGAGDKL